MEDVMLLIAFSALVLNKLFPMSIPADAATVESAERLVMCSGMCMISE